jgi:glycosyltransferase involved in cell wall biosynthesis
MSLARIWYIHPFAGGPGLGRFFRAWSLGRAWREMGVDAQVICPSFHHIFDRLEPRRGDETIQGVPFRFIRTSSYRTNGFDRLWNMARFCVNLLRDPRLRVPDAEAPDLVIASSPHPFAFLPAARLARRYGAKLVFEVRDLWPLSVVELAGVRKGHPFVKLAEWVERYAYRHCDHVVSLLPFARDHMVERGLAADKFLYVPNGIDEADAQGPTGDPPGTILIDKAREWREQGKFIVAYTGAMGPPNALWALVEAAHVLQSRGNFVPQIIMVGRGESKRDVEALAARFELRNLEFFDAVPKRELAWLLRLSDAGFISLKRQPLFRFGVSPNKLFDYMLARLPVIYAIESANDPVGEAKCGLRVFAERPNAIADAIENLMVLPVEKRVQMGESGRAYALREHGYRALARRYVELIDPSTIMIDQSKSATAAGPAAKTFR